MTDVKLLCLSHTPLMGLNDPSPVVLDAVGCTLRKLGEELRRFDPELIFLFAPDHFNGFFYDLMPSFCIGMEAESVGDYGTSKGSLQVPADTALACAEWILSSDVDCAVSYRMRVDHGFAQPLDVLTGALGRYPVIPVFINAVAVPLPTFRRARLLGQAIGRFAKTLNKRVMFIGSGGLSHNPPVPVLSEATEEVRERLIAGRNQTVQSRAERQQRTLNAAIEFAAGSSTLMPLNPLWDREFLDILESKNLLALDDISNVEVSAAAGNSAHEVKSWVAANAAMDAATQGLYEVDCDYYEAIPEWIAGFATLLGSSCKP